jgi:hypothetical protein
VANRSGSRVQAVSDFWQEYKLSEANNRSKNRKRGMANFLQSTQRKATVCPTTKPRPLASMGEQFFQKRLLGYPYQGALPVKSANRFGIIKN